MEYQTPMLEAMCSVAANVALNGSIVKRVAGLHGQPPSTERRKPAGFARKTSALMLKTPALMLKTPGADRYRQD